MIVIVIMIEAQITIPESRFVSGTIDKVKDLRRTITILEEDSKVIKQTCINLF